MGFTGGTTRVGTTGMEVSVSFFFNISRSIF
jgi:hypothetical protein